MTIKAMLSAGVLTLAAVSLAAPKTCEILLPQRTLAGVNTLAPGQYRVEVDGTQAVLTNVMTGRAVAAPVKVETTKNHEATSVAVDKRGDTRVLRSIELAHSDQTLQFE